MRGQKQREQRGGQAHMVRRRLWREGDERLSCRLCRSVAGPLLARPALTSLAEVPASAKAAEKVRKAWLPRVSKGWDSCWTSITETSPSRSPPAPAHWNSAQTLAKPGKTRLSRKAN